MKIIRRTKQLGQAVKNAQRLRQIIGVFVKHGFGDLVDRMNLQKFLPGREKEVSENEADKTPQLRLRQAFEELGPTFVKFGQLLSTRSDVLPEAFIEEFTLLQDSVQPLPYEAVKATVEKELGRKIEDAFAFFDSAPLAAASIGQVHNARLHSGEEVVVKIQRPEIDKVIETDISLLAFLASLLEKYVEESRVIGPSTIVDEFFRTLSFELDYIVEANNINKIRENSLSIPEIVIPRVYKALSTQKIITLQKLEGIRVNNLKALEAAGIDKKAIVQLGARTFFKWVMIDGLFHGDLHGGNLFILPGNKLGIVDFGIVGRLSVKSRDQLATMVVSLLNEDYENLCYEYAELGAASGSIDFESFQREVRNTLSPYIGLSLSEMNLGKILIEATRIASNYNIKVPGDWMIVFKAILTIEGMGRVLDPEFDLLSLGQDLVKDLVKNQYSVQRLSKDSMWFVRDLAALIKVLPRQMRWMMRKFNSNDFAIEIRSPDFQAMRKQLDVNGRRTSLALIISGLFISSSIALNQNSSTHLVADYPVVFLCYLILAIILLFLWIVKIF